MRLLEQDWTGAAAGLDAQGWALLPKLIDASAAAGLRGLYEKEIFRSHVIMARHGFGRGEYKYFSYPLPDPIARRIGAPKSARAVGRACATNQASGVIPCHRAVGSTGALTGYRWGVARKERLLADERRRSST